MFFLDDDITAVAVEEAEKHALPPDSIHALAQDAIKEAVTNPSTFWPEVGNQALHFGLKVVMAILLYFIGAWAIGRIKKGLMRMFERRKTERTIGTFVSSLVSIVLSVMLIVAVIGTLGIDTSSFAALLTAGGMAIGMALSGTVQNFAGGVMLLMFRPFKAGDYIRAQGKEGFVMDISIVSTKILTYENEVIVLPNGALFSGNIDNISAQEILRVSWRVSVSYGVDASKCREAILNIMHSDSRVLTSADKRPHPTSRSAVAIVEQYVPDPTVNLESLNSNDITFVVRGWCKVSDYWSLLYDMNERFYTELPPQGFTFAYPHMDVNILNQ